MLLNRGQLALEPEVEGLTCLTPVLDGQGAPRAAEERLEAIPTPPGQGDVLGKLLGARDDARGEGGRQAEPLLFVELRVLEGRQPLDLVEL